MYHEFDSLPALSDVPPRMTQDEGHAVIRLWQQEQMDSPQSALPTPSDMAEGLGIGTEDAVRLLTQVRSEREAARQAVFAAQQEELARAEAAARLAELRARTAEARAREVRADAHAYAQAHHVFPPDPPALQHKPPDERSMRRDELYRVMLQDNAYWQQKDKSIWKLPVFILALLLLGMMVASIWHPLTQNGGFLGNRPGKSCSIDNKSVPCSQIPASLRGN